LAPALVVVTVAWLRFEQPVAALWRPAVLVVLALCAAVPSRRSIRLLVALVATGVAARIAVHVDLVPWSTRGFTAFGTRFDSGFSDFYSTHLPFDPRVHAAMGELVLAAVFAFSVVAALLAAERKAVAAAFAILVGAGWPATLLGPSHAFAMGAAILGAALVVLAGLGSRRIPVVALPAAAIVAAGAVAVGSATAARHGLVHWQSWNLAHAGPSPVDVDFVWDVQYRSLAWPAHPTVVLQVQSKERPAYLRAAVLDDFIGDRWAAGMPRAADYLEPRAALRRANERRQVVTVEGLADTQLVGGSIPVRFAAGGAPFYQPVRGFASLSQQPPRGFRYTVWSYRPQPTAAELRRSAATYPAELTQGDFFDVVQGIAMPQFGSRERAQAAESLSALTPDLHQYLPLQRLAEQVAGRSRTPYDAVVRLQNWFLASGHFHYSNHPPVIAPPLVTFVTRTRSGYCQYFAGAMTLMLRYLGIPARVAVGFASGSYSASRHAWLVTDRDAHAWVEVWFKGYGWLPFDPTPPAAGAAPRPTLPGASGSTASSKSPGLPTFRNPVDSAGTLGVAGKLSRQNGLARLHAPAESNVLAVRGKSGGFENRVRPILLLLLILAVAGGAIVLTKACLRLRRRACRDPRLVAAACREDLASFLADQRIDVPRSSTLRELGERVQWEFGADPAKFVAAATAARFAPDEDAAVAALEARRELRAFLRAACHGLTRWERGRGLFSLRSLARPAQAVDASASLGSGMSGS
jgi:transglutaminase-like putative cysteine protease